MKREREMRLRDGDEGGFGVDGLISGSVCLNKEREEEEGEGVKNKGHVCPHVTWGKVFRLYFIFSFL